MVKAGQKIKLTEKGLNDDMLKKVFCMCCGGAYEREMRREYVLEIDNEGKAGVKVGYATVILNEADYEAV